MNAINCIKNRIVSSTVSSACRIVSLGLTAAATAVKVTRLTHSVVGVASTTLLTYDIYTYLNDFGRFNPCRFSPYAAYNSDLFAQVLSPEKCYEEVSDYPDQSTNGEDSWFQNEDVSSFLTGFIRNPDPQFEEKSQAWKAYDLGLRMICDKCVYNCRPEDLIEEQSPPKSIFDPSSEKRPVYNRCHFANLEMSPPSYPNPSEFVPSEQCHLLSADSLREIFRQRVFLLALIGTSTIVSNYALGKLEDVINRLNKRYFLNK